MELCSGSRLSIVVLSKKAKPLRIPPKTCGVILIWIHGLQKVNRLLLTIIIFGLAFLEILSKLHAQTSELVRKSENPCAH